MPIIIRVEINPAVDPGAQNLLPCAPNVGSIQFPQAESIRAPESSMSVRNYINAIPLKQCFPSRMPSGCFCLHQAEAAGSKSGTTLPQYSQNLGQAQKKCERL
jgi:hypothetical protein